MTAANVIKDLTKQTELVKMYRTNPVYKAVKRDIDILEGRNSFLNKLADFIKEF